MYTTTAFSWLWRLTVALDILDYHRTTKQDLRAIEEWNDLAIRDAGHAAMLGTPPQLLAYMLAAID
jgi:hypothetical protein